MTEKEKQERAELLKDRLADFLFEHEDGEFDLSDLDKILDELDELEPLEPMDLKEMLERFWDTFEERLERLLKEDGRAAI